MHLSRRPFITNLVCHNFYTLSILLRDMKAGYVLGKFRGNINHLLFMDDFDSLVQT